MGKPETPKLLAALLLVFIALYCLQIASPLRLNTDSYRFLSMAVSASEGKGFLVDGKPDVYPEGYPLFLSGLIRLGLDSTRWINAFGIFSVLFAMLAFYAILAADAALTPRIRTVLVLLPLASWVWIKHATIPLSENPYCALSFAALFALGSAWRERGWEAAGWLVAGLLLSLGAWRVRSVGVSLLAAAAYTAAWHPASRGVWLLRLPRSWKVRLLLAIAGVVILAAAGVFAWHSKTARAASGAQPGYLLLQQEAGGGRSLPALLAFTVDIHTRELGETVLNLPATRFAGWSLAFLVSGALALAASVAGLPRLARRFPPLAAYAAVYGGIILIWPFPDERFWMPLWPILAISIWLALERWRDIPAVRWGLAGYVAIFLAFGLAALCFSTRLSLAGPRFAQIYGDGTDRDTYRVAFGLADRSAAPHVDERHVRMLQRFEPLAQKAGSF